VLRTGTRWRDLPDEYPDGSACWRRLRIWEEQGVWQAAWRKLLSMLDERRLLDWEEAFLNSMFITAKKGGSAVGKTSRGKGTKCMVAVDGRGVPVGVQLASAQIAECRLAESTLRQVKVPRPGRGRPRSHLRRVIADRAMTPIPCGCG
jgi:transposase